MVRNVFLFVGVVGVEMVRVVDDGLGYIENACWIFISSVDK